MKQSLQSLCFAVLFALVLGSIAMSLRSMMQVTTQLPAPGPATAQRTPAVTPPRFTSTPTPAAARVAPRGEQAPS